MLVTAVVLSSFSIAIDQLRMKDRAAGTRLSYLAELKGLALGYCTMMLVAEYYGAAIVIFLVLLYASAYLRRQEEFMKDRGLWSVVEGEAGGDGHTK